MPRNSLDVGGHVAPEIALSHPDYFQASARQEFYWWEIDVTYYLLVIMSRCGLVWDLKPTPERVLEQGWAGQRLEATG